MPPRGPQYEMRRAKRARQWRRTKWLSEMLLRSLGGKCVRCGEGNFSLLTIDHAELITWDRYKLRYDARVSRYIEEFCSGVYLRCLCMACNGRFGQAVQQREPGEDEDERNDGPSDATPDDSVPF